MAILTTGVTKVSGKAADTSGAVALTAADVGALPTSGGYVSGAVQISGLTAEPLIIVAPSSVPNEVRLCGRSFDGSPDWYVGSYQNTLELCSNKLGGGISITADQISFKNRTMYHAGNVVGSGGIIERGSNANGEYVKFADGTLICTATTIFAAPPARLNYAAQFVAHPALVASAVSGGTAYATVAYNSTTEYIVNIFNSAGAQFTCDGFITSVGRWK